MQEFDIDDNVLAAAFALIDDVHGSHENDAVRPARRVSRPQEEKRRLIAQVEALQAQLKTTLSYTVAGSSSEWADIALHQQSQREHAVCTNALMWEAAKRQRQFAQQILTALTKAEQVLRLSLTPMEKVLRPVPASLDVPPILAERLDALHTQYLSPRSHDASIELDDAVRWHLSPSGIHFHARIARRYPFRLSAVTRALWTLLHENSSGAIIGQLEDNETTSGFFFQLEKPFGRMAIQGSMAARRTFLPDGSVLLASAALSQGPQEEGNLAAGLEIHELVSAHVVRHDNGTVSFEIVSDLEVRAVGGDDVSSQLQRLQAFRQRCSDEDGGRARQELENRLLSASLTNGLDVVEFSIEAPQNVLMPLYEDDDDAVLREALAFIGDFRFDDDDDATTETSAPLALLEPIQNNGDSGQCSPLTVTPSATTTPREAVAPRPTRVHSYSKRRNELQYLRGLVEELELELTTMRKRADDRPGSSDESCNSGSVVTVAWEQVARRQYEQRHQSEVENLKLKRLLQDQIRVGKALERVLTRKRPRDAEPLKLKMEKRHQPTNPPASRDAAHRFLDLLASVSVQYPDTDRVFAKVQHECSSVNHHDVRLVHDAALGLVLQTTECRVLPFSYADTVEAVWDSIPDVTAHGPHFVDKTDKQQQIRVQVNVSVASMRSSMDVVIASRRYVEPKRTVIVSAAVVDPSEISNMNMDGVHMRHESWAIIEPHPTTGATKHATRMTTYSTATPVVHGTTVADHTHKTGALTNFVMSALSLDRQSRHELLENRLFERCMGRDETMDTARSL